MHTVELAAGNTIGVVVGFVGVDRLLYIEWIERRFRLPQHPCYFCFEFIVTQRLRGKCVAHLHPTTQAACVVFCRIAEDDLSKVVLVFIQVLLLCLYHVVDALLVRIAQHGREADGLDVVGRLARKIKDGELLARL